MKKFFALAATVLLGISATMAQSWDFAGVPEKDPDGTGNLSGAYNADPNAWGSIYNTAESTEAVALMATATDELSVTKGLKFGPFAGSKDVLLRYYPAEYGGSHLYCNRKTSIMVPCEAGQTVTFYAASNKGGKTITCEASAEGTSAEINQVSSGAMADESYVACTMTATSANPTFVVESAVYLKSITVETPKYTVTPADGSTIGSLRYVNVTFNEYPTVAIPENIKHDACKVEGVDVNYGASSIAFNPLGNGAVRVCFDEITAAGTYKVIIPAGTLQFYNGDVAQGTNDEVSFNYTVDPALYEAPVAVVTPAAGEVGYLNKITYTFGRGEEQYTSYIRNGEIDEAPYVTDAEGNTVTTGSVAVGTDLITVTLTNPVMTPGQYTLHVPAGWAFGGMSSKYADDLAPAVEATYTVTGEGLTKYEWSRVGAENYLDTLHLTFSEKAKITSKNSFGTVYLYRNGVKSTVNFSVSKVYISTSNNNAIGNPVLADNEAVIVVSKNVTEANYTFVIPEGAFTFDDETTSTPVLASFDVVRAATHTYPSADDAYASVDSCGYLKALPAEVHVTLPGKKFLTKYTSAGTFIASLTDVERDTTINVTNSKVTVTNPSDGSDSYVTIPMPALENEVKEGDKYILTLNNGGIHYGDGDDTKANIHKLIDVIEITIIIGEEPAVAIERITEQAGKAEAYDLMGRKTEALRGFAIIGGQKVILK